MTHWDERIDVVVIGSGLAGLAAAIEARQAGAEVAVFEKMPVIGGNSRISDGALAAPGNFMQRRRGVGDSPERFQADMLRAGMGLNHPELVRIVAEQAAAAIEWTRRELGVAYLDRLDRFGGHSVARCLTVRSHCGVAIVKALAARLGRLGVSVRRRCRLERLLTAPDGGVGGVELRVGGRFDEPSSGVPLRVGANRAVVLATGGFGSDVDFRQRQVPALDASIDSTNHRGATADGIIAALRIAALPVHLSWIQVGPWACPDEPGYGKGGRFASYSIFPTGIVVDPATGRRIVDEWGDRRTRSDAIMAAGHPCIGITDRRGAQQDPESLAHGLKTGKVGAFDDLPGLAAAFDMPVDALVETVKRYNRRIVDREADPFGKPLQRGARPLDRPPFYALRLWPKVHYTPGGVGIDGESRVLDLAGRPIGRLFAAGEVCGGIHGASRLGGCALTECLVFGRIAGRQAARCTARPAIAADDDG